MRSSRRVGRAAAIVAALAMVAAACGDDAGDDGPATDDVTTVDEASAPAAATTDAPAADDEHGDDEDHDDHDHDDDGHDDDHDRHDDGDGAGSDAAEHDSPQVRLFVADADSPEAVFIDTATRETVGTVELDDVAALGTGTSEDGRYVYVAHAESVTVVDGAVWTVPHGSHAHYYSADPVVLGTVEGTRPTHIVSHDGVAALWFDGSGTAELLDEDDIAEGSVEVFATIETEMPHHGFAVPFHGHYIVTSQEEETESGMPGVVGVRAVSGDLEATFDCLDTHGEGALGDAGLAACDDGVLVITEDDHEWFGELVAYPDVDDEDPWGYGDGRAWGLTINPEVDHVAAPLGARHVLWLDPASGEAEPFEAVEAGSDAAVAQFGVAIHDDGDVVAVLSTDGYVRTIDTSDGSIVDEAEVMEPFVEDFETELWPQALMVDDSVIVSDPHGGQIVELDIDGLTVTDTIDPGVTPAVVQVVGG